MNNTPYTDRNQDSYEHAADPNEYVRCDNCFEYRARAFMVTVQNDNGTEAHYCANTCATHETDTCGDCLTTVHISEIVKHDGLKFCKACAAGIEE